MVNYMKTKVGLAFLIITTAFVYAQPVSSGRQEYQWNALLNILDDTGAPVAEAKVKIGYDMSTNVIVGLTDTNGLFAAKHLGHSVDLTFQVEKENYYPSRAEHHLGFSYNPERWNFTQIIHLRKIGDRIPMYAKRQEMKFPKLDEPIGFDLMAGDWVTPYGKGFHTDLLFKANREVKNDREFTANLIVTFPNKGDGITIAPAEPVTGSEFITSRIAAEKGYQPELDLHYSNTERPEAVFGYFIRVRTELDQGGNIISALYGKVKGNFRFYAGTIAPTSGMGFDYYLNPTPNNRNVEFNPKRNLVKDLNPLEEVKEP
jgi:hypothetical protein